MSYILEALKKDEAASDPAAAAALALAQSRPKRSWPLWLLGGALLVNAAVLGYLFFPRGSDGTQARSRSDLPLSQPDATRELLVRPRQRVAPPGSSTVRRSAPAPRPATPSAPDPAPAVAAASQPSTADAAAPSGGRVLSPEQAAALNLLPAATAAPQTPAPDPGGTVIAPTPKAVTKPPPVDDERSRRIIQLAELPPADRQDFPKLEFSTHIFADDPALRAVVVNSRRLNEGESIGEMVLRAVTEDGILVDYRGYRVAVSVIEEWK